MKTYQETKDKTIDIAEFSDINLINAYGGTIPTTNNALNVQGSNNSLNGKIEKITTGENINMPTGVTHAFKWQYWFDVNNTVVILFELYPTLGRVWINRLKNYSTGIITWDGWKLIAQPISI